MVQPFTPVADERSPEALGAGVHPVSEENQFLRHLIRGMRCGVLTVDRTGRLLMLNTLAVQILELDEVPPPGTLIEDAVADHPQLAQILREAFTMTSLPNRAEIDLRCRSDAGKTIGLTLSLVAEEGGEPYAAAAFFKDLTPVEHREEQERLRDRLAALGQMAANMAHEIRNPLASIGVTCALLKRRLSESSDDVELLDKIAGEIHRLNATITESLEFVRPLSLSMGSASIDELVRDALATARKRHASGRIEVEHRSEDSLPRVIADPTRLRQVFENLCVNAFEAMEAEGGRLEVDCSVVPAPGAASIPYQPQGGAGETQRHFDHYIQVKIHDSGPGIPEEHRDRLFYPFFTTKKQGSGVGLALSKKIVDSHHGLLDVESEPGEGALFTVRIPMVVDSEVEGT